MANPSKHDLFALATPYRDLINGTGRMLRVGLLVTIAQKISPMSDYSMNGLLKSANEYINGNCDLGLGIELGLLLIISQNVGGSSGSGGGLAGAGSPYGSVAGANGQTYVDTTTDNFWVNNGGGVNGWVELIA